MRDSTVRLSRDEIVALLHAYSIEEFPTSNPLGCEGGRILEAAEKKLRAELARGCPNIECKDGVDQHVNAPCTDCGALL